VLPPTSIKNLLLEKLTATSRNRILKLCTTVHWQFGSVLYEAHQPFKHVFFPLTGFISSVVMIEDHPPLEITLIGNEGMLGVNVALGINNAPMQSIVQGEGTALRMPIHAFKRELRSNPALQALLNRYIYVSMQNFAQGTVCIHFHRIEARLARWLLMTNDRAHSDTFLLTHAFLAQMLGVRRSGVSVAAKMLEKKSLISYARGKITIRTREGLESIACKCYGEMNNFYNERV
jgi:CRP-like cAMP-binding protein